MKDQSRLNGLLARTPPCWSQSHCRPLWGCCLAPQCPAFLQSMCRGRPFSTFFSLTLNCARLLPSGFPGAVNNSLCTRHPLRLITDYSHPAHVALGEVHRKSQPFLRYLPQNPLHLLTGNRTLFTGLQDISELEPRERERKTS